MWRLRIAEGDGPWLRTVNGHVGRQVWTFDPEATPEELAEVERAREDFRIHRFERKHSADLLMRLQVRRRKAPLLFLLFIGARATPPEGDRYLVHLCPSLTLELGKAQFARENPLGAVLPRVEVAENEAVGEDAVATTLRRAMNFHSTIQARDGHWPGDYGGPNFLMPGLVITLYVSGALNTALSREHQAEIRRYLFNHQNEDGGWGLHIEGPSTMFCTTLTYVTLRLLGEGADGGEGAVAKGRQWILDHGGATACTSWGKLWLSVWRSG